MVRMRISANLGIAELKTGNCLVQNCAVNLEPSKAPPKKNRAPTPAKSAPVENWPCLIRATSVSRQPFRGAKRFRHQFKR